MPKDARLIDYYVKRASEYEQIYAKPERQNDLAALRKIFHRTLTGNQVLEIACGTGYWTQVVAQTAKTITATDFNEAVLEIARTKKYGCPVCFQQADAFHLSFAQNNFTAGLAVHWWSHLKKAEIKNFLSQFHRQFSAGSLMVFMDNKFVTGSSTPISRTDDDGNTYQLRKLENGGEHEILKNFPDEKEVRTLIENFACEIFWSELPHFWLLTYKLP